MLVFNPFSLIGLAFATTVGLLMLILACALPEFGNYYPLFVSSGFYHFLDLIWPSIYLCPFPTPSPDRKPANERFFRHDKCGLV